MTETLAPHSHYAVVLATLTNELQRKRAQLAKAERRGSPGYVAMLEREIANTEAAIAATNHLWAELAALRGD